jgi:hypothetical protein
VPLVNQLLGRGKSVIDSILEIVGQKLGDTGKHILVQHLEGLDITSDELTVKEIPKLAQIVQNIITPIFGKKSAKEIGETIKKISSIQ